MKTPRRLCTLALAFLLLFSLTACSRVSIDGSSGGTVKYQVGTTRFTDDLTEDEVADVAKILNGKSAYSSTVIGTPSCGYSFDVSITIDGSTYALAMDKCTTVKLMEKDLYIDITNDERNVLEQIFISRGGEFPCV